MRLPELATPAALIDKARMTRNIALMQNRLNALGVRLRPHVKTAKCLEVAKRQSAAGGVGVTVSTLLEAEQFFDGGFDDVFYAVGIAPQKLDRALALRRKGCALTILVDSVAGARAVIEKSRSASHTFDVMIEVDTDGHRSGVASEGKELCDIGAMLHTSGAALKGVMTHAGSSYELDTPEALRHLAEQERRLCVRAAQQLRASGLPCPEVSVGSTPTALSAIGLDGVTEVRAGVYVFFDLVMANIGVCKPEDVALSVLTTVIGHQPSKGWAIVDAGWMAMSRDRGTQRQTVDYGYGAVCDVDGSLMDGFLLSGAKQEHGILSRRDGIDADICKRFPLGTQLRILPNHACATGAQFSKYHLVSADGSARDWKRIHGW